MIRDKHYLMEVVWKAGKGVGEKGMRAECLFQQSVRGKFLCEEGRAEDNSQSAIHTAISQEVF